jgi:hypothetical protein
LFVLKGIDDPWQKKMIQIYDAVTTASKQGCQIFLGATYKNWKNIPK